MARISKLIVDSSVEAGDKIVTTNVSDQSSKNIKISQIEGYVYGVQGDRRMPIISQLDFTTVEPILVDGARYINTVAGISVSGINVNANSIYQGVNGKWNEIVPVTGWMVWDKYLSKNLIFDGNLWNLDNSGNGLVTWSMSQW